MKNADFTVSNVSFVYYRKYSSNYALNVRSRRYNGLTLVLSGSLCISFDDQTYSAGPGSIILQRTGDSYRLFVGSEEDVEYIVISYLTEPAGIVPELLPEHVFRTEHIRRYRDAFEQALRVYNSRGICASPLLRALVQEILCNIIRESYPKSLLAENNPAAIARFFIEEYFDQDISSDDIAEAAGCSASHLRVLFRRAYGETPIQFLNRIRVERACEMISSRMFRLDEVAAACGFQNVYYFNRVFKSITGTTPGKY